MRAPITDFLLDQGILDGEPDAKTFHEWDMGFDFYAPQTFCDERGRRILIGWAGIGDAEYDNEPTVRQGWQHCLTLPRQIIYRNGKLLQQPLEELKELRGPQISIHAQTSTIKPVFELEMKAFKEDWFAGIGTETDALMLRYKDGILSFRITGEAGCGRTSREMKIDNVKNVRMIVDTSIAEIYVNDGETVITSRFYFSDNNRNIETRGKETVADAWNQLFVGDVQMVIYTKGADGAECYTREGNAKSAGCRVKAVDTIGAGDAFIGSFLYQLAADSVTVEHLSAVTAEKMEQYLDFSNRYCAKSVQKSGAIASYPAMDEM